MGEKAKIAGLEEAMENEGSSSRALRVSVERHVNACVPKEATKGRRLGSGSFGIVYALDPKPKSRASSLNPKKPTTRPDNPFQNDKWVLKASLIDTPGNRDTFDREIYFLETLGKLHQSIVPKLMQWNTDCANGTIGIQVIERFDSSAKDLLIRQANELGLGRGDWAVHLSQLRRIIKLGRDLDALGIIHGDAKLANLLSNVNGTHIVWADFGFTGRRIPTTRAKSPHYNPLMGFTRFSFKCPGKTKGKGKEATLTHVPPPSLWTRWNSIQLFFNLTSHDLYLIPKEEKSRSPSRAKSAGGAGSRTKIESMRTEQLGKKRAGSGSRTASATRNRYMPASVLSSLFGFNQKLLDEMIKYCPGASHYLL